MVREWNGTPISGGEIWTHPLGREARLTIDGAWQRGEAFRDMSALPYFRGWRMAEIGDEQIRAYVAHRQAQPITVRKQRLVADAEGRTQTEDAGIL
jgi:hypothetical protein